MKRILYILLAAAASCGMLASCNDDEKGNVNYHQEPEPAWVTLERSDDPETGAIRVSFEPNAQTARVVYALALEGQRDDFIGGTLDGTAEVTGNDPFTRTYENLDKGVSYLVMARAYDGNNEAGAISTLSISIPYGEFDFGNQFLTDRSAAFYVTCSDEYYKFDYALGKSTDRGAFEQGTLAGMVTRNEIVWCYTTHLDLQPATDYVFFARGYDRYGTETGVLELPVTTPAAGEGVSVEFSVPSLDIYKGTYTFTPNAECGKIAVAVGTVGAFDTQFYHDLQARGNIMGRMEEWVDTESANVTVGDDGDLTVEVLNTDLTIGGRLDVFVLMYDRAGEPAGVIKFSPDPAAADPSAGRAEVEVSIDAINDSSISFTVNANSNTFGYFYRIMPDYSIEGTSTDDENIWSLIRFQPFVYLKEDPNPSTFTDVALPSNWASNGYYLMVFPCNANGASGRGVKVLEKFETPDQDEE